MFIMVKKNLLRNKCRLKVFFRDNWNIFQRYDCNGFVHLFSLHSRVPATVHIYYLRNQILYRGKAFFKLTSVTRGKKINKKIWKKNVTPRLPISVHKIIQPIWSSRLAGYKKEYYKINLNNYSFYQNEFFFFFIIFSMFKTWINWFIRNVCYVLWVNCLIWEGYLTHFFFFYSRSTKPRGGEGRGGVSCVQPKPSKLNAQENSKRINASVKV